METYMSKGRYNDNDSFEFVQDFSEIAFGFGYSYTKGERKKNLIHLTVLFWHINFAWK